MSTGAAIFSRSSASSSRTRDTKAESCTRPSKVKTSSSRSKSRSGPTGRRTRSPSTTEIIFRTPGYSPPTSRRNSRASTVSKAFVSRLITSIRFGEYLSVSSTVTLARSPGWPGAISTG